MLNKVVDYKILSSSRANSLELLVKEAIKDSWAPSGPVFMYKEDINQAMVKFGRG